MGTPYCSTKWASSERVGGRAEVRHACAGPQRLSWALINGAWKDYRKMSAPHQAIGIGIGGSIGAMLQCWLTSLAFSHSVIGWWKWFNVQPHGSLDGCLGCKSYALCFKLAIRICIHCEYKIYNLWFLPAAEKLQRRYSICSHQMPDGLLTMSLFWLLNGLKAFKKCYHELPWIKKLIYIKFQWSIMLY